MNYAIFDKNYLMSTILEAVLSKYNLKPDTYFLDLRDILIKTLKHDVSIINLTGCLHKEVVEFLSALLVNKSTQIIVFVNICVSINYKSFDQKNINVLCPYSSIEYFYNLIKKKNLNISACTGECLNQEVIDKKLLSSKQEVFSNREKDILILLSRGMSSLEIAQILKN